MGWENRTGKTMGGGVLELLRKHGLSGISDINNFIISQRSYI
jgi:hypothetical protein